jgi:maltose/moltooligosaccharide transporter
MEPYRAFIGDKLPEYQQTYGFQMQSLFVGAGITLANLSLFFFQKYFGGSSGSGIPTWVYYSFFIGAFCSIASVGWSVYKTPENPPTEEELAKLKLEKENSNFFTPFIDIINSIKEMPKILWQLALVYLFQWYALFIYWQFVTPMLKRTMFGISEADETKASQILELSKNGSQVSSLDLSWAENISKMVETAVGQTGLMNGTYNLVTMVTALILVPFALKFTSKKVHIVALFGTAIALFLMPFIKDQYLILLPMILFGIGWASMMGLPYSMVSPDIPSEKRGVYMGIINMMIVIPMLIQTISFGWIFKNLLGENPVNAILMAGVLFVLASISVTFMKVKNVS